MFTSNFWDVSLGGCNSSGTGLLVLTNLPWGWFSLFRAADSCGDPSASSCFASSLLLSTLQHLLELSIWRSRMIFFSKRNTHLSYMPYAWMFLDMAVTWAIQKLPISNQPLGNLPIGCNDHQIYESMIHLRWLNWSWSDPPPYATKRNPDHQHRNHGWKHWGDPLWKPRMIRALVDTRWYEYIMWIYTSCWGNRVTQVLGNWWKQCTFAVLSWRPLGQYACLHKSDTRNTRTKIICSLLFHAVA